jgi:penicillin amidase
VRRARQLLYFVLFAIVLAVGGGWVWLRTGLPPAHDSIRSTAVEAPVRVWRDARAVPHVFASNEADAYFALGYLHAQDRLWQMDMMRRLGAGRLAEVVGNLGLDSDRLMRMLGLYRRAEASYALLSFPARRALDRYADGVNAWLDGHDGALPPEFTALFYRPEPWRPADSLVWAEIMTVQLSGNFRAEIERMRLLADLGPERAATFLPDGLPTPSTIAAAGALHPLLDRLAAALPEPIGPATASNEWVLSGARSATGMPLLANDPHLGLGAPSLWYLVRIVTPELTLVGATAPGVPILVLGHNGRIAWGLTTTGADTQDLFIETVDPGDWDRYLAPGGRLPFEVRNETIAVRGGDPVDLAIRSTRHGPVVSDLDPDLARSITGDGKVAALASTALAGPNTTAQAFYDLNHARDWPEFLAALRSWTAPVQNVVYADVDGAIGLKTPGLVPLRPRGRGLEPVDGASGADDWTGTVPFDALPTVHNPPDGMIVNANNPVVGPDFPYWIGSDASETWRAQRIIDVLGDAGARTIDDMTALQADTVALDARQVLPLMLAAGTGGDARLAETQNLLAHWDARMDRDRPEPLVYVAWLRHTAMLLFAGAMDDPVAHATPDTIARVLTRDRFWCDDAATVATDECAALLRRSLTAALDELAAAHGIGTETWRWGDAHVAPLAHPIFGRVPVLRDMVNIGTATDGGSDTVNRAGMRLDDDTDPYADRHGPGYRAVYDLAALDRSRFVISTGQSGNPLSPHYGDFVADWRDGRSVTLAGDESAFAANGEPALEILPQAADAP